MHSLCLEKQQNTGERNHEISGGEATGSPSKMGLCSLIIISFPIKGKNILQNTQGGFYFEQVRG